MDGIPPEEPIKPSPVVSSMIDVPEKAISAITTNSPPITPPTMILGFNVVFELSHLLNVNIKNPYSAILQNNHAIFSGCTRGKD